MTCIGPEDWGWMVELVNEEFPLWIGCGHQDGTNDEFLCFIEPSKPVIRKGFKDIDTTVQVGRVSDALAKIIWNLIPRSAILIGRRILINNIAPHSFVTHSSEAYKKMPEIDKADLSASFPPPGLGICLGVCRPKTGSCTVTT